MTPDASAAARAFPGLWVAATIRAPEGSIRAMAHKSRGPPAGASAPPISPGKSMRIDHMISSGHRRYSESSRGMISDLEITERLAAAALLGCAVGFERERL